MDELITNGYVLYRNFFPKGLIEGLRKDIFKVFNLHTDKELIDLYAKDFERYYDLAKKCGKLLSLHQTASCELIFDALCKFGIGCPLVNTKPLVSFSCKSLSDNDYRYWKIPAHQDYESTWGTTNGLTCWVPLVDVDEELGPLEVIPGSHTNGLYEHISRYEIKDPVEGDFVSLPMNVGDALFMSYFLVHRSGLNVRDDKIRLSVHFRYDDVFGKKWKASS